MDEHNRALNWSEEYLKIQRKLDIIKTQQVAETSYSTVYKIETNQGSFYVKKTPKDLFLEPYIIDVLNKQGDFKMPELMATNDELSCFLMKSCGDETLRRLFNGKANLMLLKQGLRNFTSIQRSLERSIPQMLSLGIPDWRIDVFVSLYRSLIEQEQLLLDDGMAEQEIKQLHQQENVCADLCSQLLKFEMPATINHCDFHENNMVVDNKTGELSIIDWGETVVAHPFFSLCGLLWNITYFQDIKAGDNRYHELQLFCIDSWLDLYDQEKLLQILNITNKLNGIYAALGYERLYKATCGLEDNVQKNKNGAIAGCLRTFLSIDECKKNKSQRGE